MARNGSSCLQYQICVSQGPTSRSCLRDPEFICECSAPPASASYFSRGSREINETRNWIQWKDVNWFGPRWKLRTVLTNQPTNQPYALCYSETNNCSAFQEILIILCDLTLHNVVRFQNRAAAVLCSAI